MSKNGGFLSAICLRGLLLMAFGLMFSHFGLLFDAESICSGTPTPCSDWCEQLPPGHEQIRQGCQHIDLAAVLGQATKSGLLKAELLFDHSERVLELGADVCLCRLDQILELSIFGVG